MPALAAGLPAAAWQTLGCRTGHNGPLVRQAALVPVWRWEDGNGGQAQGLHLLISRELDGTHLKYSRCYAPPGAAALDVGWALYRQMQRDWIERVFREGKQPLGLHQKQTRAWPAWPHHIALTMMGLHLLLYTQVRQREAIPNLSFASLKLVLAQKMQNLLHQDEALLAAVRQRAQANTPKPTRPNLLK